MADEQIYRLALSMVEQVGDVQARLLIQHFGDASSIFNARSSDLEKIEGIGPTRAEAIRNFRDFDAAENELRFMEDNDVRMLFLTDADYPKRLENCYDAPPLLFYKGKADLNASRMLAVVGTRSLTDYGRQCTERLIRELSSFGITIVSGLAFGIDALAHRIALEVNLPTVGVVGHGLHMVYPYAHKSLASEIIEKQGGLLSEFMSTMGPERHHFPLRNRIVAGITDATVVLETHLKGGSLITAKLADGYNRDVFAVPGRTTDYYSGGCNHLIQHNRAFLLQEAKDLLEVLGWSERRKEKNLQRAMFIEFTPDEEKILSLLKEKDAVHIDEINIRSGLSSSSIAALILNLEIQNVITALPGKMYRLL